MRPEQIVPFAASLAPTKKKEFKQASQANDDGDLPTPGSAA